jgi:hypothetical protein
MYFKIFCIHVYASKSDFHTFTLVIQKVKKTFKTNQLSLTGVRAGRCNAGAGQLLQDADQGHKLWKYQRR